MDEKHKPIILAVETATRTGSVNLAVGGKALCSLTGDSAVSHSTHLIEHIDELLRTAGVTLNEIELFAAAVGPGSFTGLRIGVATIKGFAASLDRKCVGVSTLAAIAHASGPSARTVALLPAGRGEVFAQLFTVDEDGAVEPSDGAAHLSPGAVVQKYGGLRLLTWAGEGSQLHADTLRSWAQHNGIEFVEGHSAEQLSLDADHRWTLAAPCETLAESVSALAWHVYQLGKLISPEDLQAVYVRPSDAETKEQWREATLPPTTGH